MEAEGGLWSACQVQASVQVVLSKNEGKGVPGDTPATRNAIIIKMTAFSFLRPGTQ